MSTLLPGKKPRWSGYPRALILCLVVVLSACGQKGPLYLPEPEPEAKPSEENRFSL